MARTLSFPGLGLSFSLSREVFSIGPLTVYWYGIIVVTGIALGVVYAVWRAKQFGLDPDRMLDVCMYSIVAGVVGSRLYYVAFTWDYYRVHPAEIIRVWEGGIAFYGGVIGAVVCAILLCRRWKIPFLVASDAALGGLLLGQSIGRWGNFDNIEAFGGYFTGRWRMVSPVIDAYFHQNPTLLPGFTPDQVLAMNEIPVHPTFFYESVWTMLGFLLLVWYTRHRRFTGELTLIYFAWNGLGRAFIEGLRTDSLMWGGMRVSQVLAVLLVIASAVLWMFARKKISEGTVPALALPGSEGSVLLQPEPLQPAADLGQKNSGSENPPEDRPDDEPPVPENQPVPPEQKPDEDAPAVPLQDPTQPQKEDPNEADFPEAVPVPSRDADPDRQQPYHLPDDELSKTCSKGENDGETH